MLYRTTAFTGDIPQNNRLRASLTVATSTHGITEIGTFFVEAKMWPLVRVLLLLGKAELPRVGQVNQQIS